MLQVQDCCNLQCDKYGGQIIHPSAKRNSVSEDGYCLRSLEHNMQAHDRQSRHVAGHDVNYLPEEKENDYCAAIPPCHSDTSRR